MDIFVLIIYDYLIAPLKILFISFLALDYRQSIFYLFIAYLIAFVLYYFNVKRKEYKEKEYQSFWQFIGGKEVLLHRSSLVDYQYVFVRVLLINAFVTPIIGLIFLEDFLTGQTMSEIYTNILGPMENPIDLSIGYMLLYGFVTFLLADFCHYWVHRIFHSKWLWEFHKVHHSAEVLNPMTAQRIHVVETFSELFVYYLIGTPILSFMLYLSGGQAEPYTLFGVLYLSVIFHSVGANLRHTHIWLSFGPKIEKWINSPAQHQIHHSDDPKHYNKNFGTNLSIWDWMFGTLYTTTPEREDITYGISKADNERYSTLSSLIFEPFRWYYRKFKKKISKNKVHKNRADVQSIDK